MRKRSKSREIDISLKQTKFQKLLIWFETELGRWAITGIIMTVVFVLGGWGYHQYYSGISEIASLWDLVYKTLKLFTIGGDFNPGEINVQLQIARFLAPAVTILVTVQTLTVVFRDQFRLLCLRLWHDHVVICGLGRKGLSLAESYRADGHRVVIIENDEHNNYIAWCKQIGMVILIGNAGNPEMLKKARAGHAKYIMSVCGDDGTNAEVAVISREIVSTHRKDALECMVHISDPSLCLLLREREIILGKSDAFRLGFFNIYESGARELLLRYPPIASHQSDYPKRSHVCIIGIGRFGESVLVNVAKIWKYANFDKKLHITMVDKDANKKKRLLSTRYPEIDKICELVPQEIDIQSAEFEAANFLIGDGGEFESSIVYVCLDGDTYALSAALRLHRLIRQFQIPIVVRTLHAAGLAELLKAEATAIGKSGDIKVFALLDQTCTSELVLHTANEIIARTIHEDYIKQNKGTPNSVPWEELTKKVKESNKQAAEHIRTKLEAIGHDFMLTTKWNIPLFNFSEEQIELMAIMEHNRYLEERRKQEHEENSKMVSWDQLSEADKETCRRQVRQIPELLAKVGIQII